ncbi:MAG: nucleotidyltransferase domain-containing protein [Melioribacteraceae bacterium]|nr:nucleotidyltransferase domain-containing protein [Melioribacteraceae bacterium]MCF8352999.1 nucleotidyltransferase domain-containing protein [Melioribacteraceae bacterium]MCF8392890.1 nucleotidyltransferase domain-containing protein [Melioribacteraceae bacterium]MCF8417816.1 nucleotidyltransferase domain-containing protein [Melioribacteraceae bacterium]
MNRNSKSLDSLISQLQERAKELNCLYTVEEVLTNNSLSIEESFQAVVDSIPHGWQYPTITQAKLELEDSIYKTKGYFGTEWRLVSQIRVQDKEVGLIKVVYTEDMPVIDEGPFLKEERKLLDTIAEKIGHFVLHQRLKAVINDFNQVKDGIRITGRGEWRIVLDMIRKTDPNLFMGILRKLLHQLTWDGVEDAEKILKNSGLSTRSEDDAELTDENKPMKKRLITNYDEYIEQILSLADEYLPDSKILEKIQKWIQEDKSSALVKVLENQDTSLSQIGDAIRKYFHLAPEKFELSPSTKKGLRVSLLRRFFTEDLHYISIAKEYVKLTDFYNLIDKMIFPLASHGKLGGKSAGLFLAAHVIKKNKGSDPIMQNIKIPKSWYVTSDGILYFMQYNNLEEVLEQKYKEIDEVRLEYPHIVQLFKNSQFPPDIVKGLSVALDDFGEVPLIVRSSSLLEDQIGAAFSGKYKSLFLANQGSKKERLSALMDAIAEVYASTFGPDPIEYRASRGLLDFHEEMGIIIQEVVGRRIGDYFLPAFAGVAFSNNEFRWSPRIKRQDGLIRLVPGLGTRAVDRLSNDYPVLIAPGQPKLRVNVTIEETIKYSPKYVDVINLITNQFETIEVPILLKNFGDIIPGIENYISKYDGNHLTRPNAFQMDFENDDFVFTFDGLINNSNFIKQANKILKMLQKQLNMPVDIEFASDGNDFYMLQCRSQSHSLHNTPDPIPKDIARDKVVFSAKKYVSNGRVPDVSHIVYIDPQGYYDLETKSEMLAVGRIIGKLNKLLPKRKFILMGPGRWGSRGDIKLGVNVTYADISNTAMLVEIAMKKGNYMPDLSFGTHFFQDLVEASIRYLPLYPDDEGIIFNDNFLRRSKNILKELIPETNDMEKLIHVIDIPSSTEGNVLKVLMNADLDEALGILRKPSESEIVFDDQEIEYEEAPQHDHWKWRYKMAETLAMQINAEKYGVKGMYIFGSTKNANAGPASDIDLLIHIDDDESTRNSLHCWLAGWSLCLSEINYLRTGYRTDGLLDIHYITDRDIKNKTSYAIKIGAVTDAARPLSMGNQ